MDRGRWGDLRMARRACACLVVLVFLASAFGILAIVPHNATGAGTYSTNDIALIGEASTGVVACVLSGTVVFPVPDENLQPTDQYYQYGAQSASWGSAFFVSSDGYMITAGHVVGAMTKADFAEDPYTFNALISATIMWYLDQLSQQGYDVTSDLQTQIANYFYSYSQVYNPTRALYVAMGEVPQTIGEYMTKGWFATVEVVSPYIERDVALLKVQQSNCPVMVIGDSNQIRVGDSSYFIGFPGITTDLIDPHATQGLLTPTMASGIISGKRSTTSQIPILETTATTTHGFSGGPGLNDEAAVIGIVSRGSVSTTTGEEVGGYTFLIASSIVRDMMTSHNVNNSQGAVDREFREGLSYYNDKHYSAALDKFQTVVQRFDKHWVAQSLIKECQDAINNGQDVPLSTGLLDDANLPLIAGAAVVAVAGGGAITLLYMRRKKGAGPPQR